MDNLRKVGYENLKSDSSNNTRKVRQKTENLIFIISIEAVRRLPPYEMIANKNQSSLLPKKSRRVNDIFLFYEYRVLNLH